MFARYNTVALARGGGRVALHTAVLDIQLYVVCDKRYYCVKRFVAKLNSCLSVKRFIIQYSLFIQVSNMLSEFYCRKPSLLPSGLNFMAANATDLKVGSHQTPQSSDAATPTEPNITKLRRPEPVLTLEEIGYMSSQRGNILLWQFLLDLLSDAHYSGSICWHGPHGEFKFLEPDKVARLWGIRKNKPAMTYEKLSRSLRYYYEGNMICKVRNQRFVYKFTCNMEMLIGLSAMELATLVRETSDSMQARRTLVYDAHKSRTRAARHCPSILTPGVDHTTDAWRL